MPTSGYPGERVSPHELRRLAEAYRGVAYVAAGSIQRGDPLTAAPMRLLALHAVELNLSALLLLRGHSPPGLRRLGHDLAARLALASACGLVLRRRTAEHIEAVAQGREYLVARYGPELLGTASQINRLLATMDEVAAKVGRAFENAASSALPAHDGDDAPGSASLPLGV